MRPIRQCIWFEDENTDQCPNMVEGNTDYCASHNAAIRKAQRVKTKVVVPVKKITEKRAKQNREYLEMREQFLEQYPICQCVDCFNPSTQIHHRAGKANSLLTDPENFFAICDDCHKRITEHSAQAIKDGYSKLRSI